MVVPVLSPEMELVDRLDETQREPAALAPRASIKIGHNPSVLAHTRGKRKGVFHNMQSEQRNPEAVEQSREQVLELGSDLTRGKAAISIPLTIIGQIEGHQVLPETAKTTKYEHVLPLLAGIEESG